MYSAEEIQKATGNYAAAKCLGKGAFGEVYRAELRCSDVAIKILKTVWKLFDASNYQLRTNPPLSVTLHRLLC